MLDTCQDEEKRIHTHIYMHEIRVSERVCACVFEEYVCCIILLFCPVNFHTHMLPTPPIPFDDNDNSDDNYQRCDNVFPLFYFSFVFEHVIHTHTHSLALARYQEGTFCRWRERSF